MTFEPFRRADWGQWIDEDHDCQNTRTEVLIAESLRPVTFSDVRRCRVARGLWRCPYTGRDFFDPHDLDVDHMVPLANAHASGGHAWPRPRRTAYANDLVNARHLVAVSRSANRSKGSRSPDAWLPRQRASWCWYARAWREVKQRWGLAMTSAERARIFELERDCSRKVHVSSQQSSVAEIAQSGAPLAVTQSVELHTSQASAKASDRAETR